MGYSPLGSVFEAVRAGWIWAMAISDPRVIDSMKLAVEDIDLPPAPGAPGEPLKQRVVRHAPDRAAQYSVCFAWDTCVGMLEEIVREQGEKPTTVFEQLLRRVGILSKGQVLDDLQGGCPQSMQELRNVLAHESGHSELNHKRPDGLRVLVAKGVELGTVTRNKFPDVIEGVELEDMAVRPGDARHFIRISPENLSKILGTIAALAVSWYESTRPETGANGSSLPSQSSTSETKPNAELEG